MPALGDERRVVHVGPARLVETDNECGIEATGEIEHPGDLRGVRRKRSAPRFLMTQALDDETVFNELIRANILRVSESGATAQEIAP